MDKFLKCDLHIHSSSCYSRSYTEADFVSSIKNSGLDVIAITDHNIIDIELFKRISKETSDILNVIPGVELNINIDEKTINSYNLVVKGNFFHAVLWFNPESIDEAGKKIEELLFGNGVEIKERTMKSISKSTKDISFSLLKVQELLKDIDYYLVFHEGKGERNLSDYLVNKDEKSNVIASNKTFKHNLFYYNNKFAIEGKSNKTTKISNYFDQHLNTIVSSFFFSDASNLDEIGTKFTWINFDGTFESLILPLSDPEVRVKTSDITKKNPQKNTENYLESVVLKMKKKDSNSQDSCFIKEIPLCFSPAYNGIIGSRGSGKTLLGSVLSETGLSRYSDYIEIKDIKYKMSNKDHYQNDCPKHKYLAQNSLLQLFESGLIKEVDFLKEFYAEQERNKKKIYVDFKNITTKLLNFEKSQFETLQSSSQSTIKDITFLESAINDEYMIPALNPTEFQNSSLLLENNSSKLDKIKTDVSQLQKYLNDIELSDKKYTELLYYNELMNNFRSKSTLLLKELNDLIRDTETRISNLDKTAIINRNSNITKYSELLKLENKFTDPKSYITLDDKSGLHEQLINITKYRSLINESKKFINNEISKVKSETKSKPFVLNGSDEIVVSTTLEDNLDYEFYINEERKGKVTVQYDEFLFRVLLDYKDTEKLKNNFNGNKYKSLATNNQYIEKFYINLEEKIKKVGDFKIRLYFNDKDLEKYSPGKKSEILLDIFLEDNILGQDYNYIILDQPEDNMDTNTITKKLIKRLRELKSQIQIFVISHSAAVIVNGDAENIIFANDDEKEKRINYTQGRIIDRKIKMNIVETLDGGEKNLKMRLNKYDFKLESEINDENG